MKNLNCIECGSRLYAIKVNYSKSVNWLYCLQCDDMYRIKIEIKRREKILEVQEQMNREKIKLYQWVLFKDGIVIEKGVLNDCVDVSVEDIFTNLNTSSDRCLWDMQKYADENFKEHRYRFFWTTVDFDMTDFINEVREQMTPEIKTGYEIYDEVADDITDMEDVNNPYNKRYIYCEDEVEWLKQMEQISLTCQATGNKLEPYGQFSNMSKNELLILEKIREHIKHLEGK